MKRIFALSCLAAFHTATAAPVINEIYYRPPGAVEPTDQEWIEIHNPAVLPVDVSGWVLSKGVNFTFPPGTSIPAGGYLVVAANVAAFNAANPAFSGTVIGGWIGQLSNGGEELQLDDALGTKISDVVYADEGEWALRGRSAESFGHKGWDWFCPPDGGGFTFELRNPVLGVNSGQNWGASSIAGGTPGAVNTAFSADIAPLIKDAKHKPEIPRSTEAIVISADIENETPGATTTLHWRLDAGTWNSLSMVDSDGDGDVEATIPPQANLAVVEWYISSTDGTHSRTWPAPARTSDPGVIPETFGQAANALLQVDDSFDPNATFLSPANNQTLRFIMTDAERLELAQIGSTNGQEESAAEMNGTLISHDGTGIRTRYLVGYRNRGMGSALGPPNNYHVSLRSDDKWNGRGSLAVNCRYGYIQALGNALVQRAGLPTQEAVVVKVRVNGADLAQTGSLMYGRYALLEGRGAEWAESHYPADSEGNFYRLDDHAPGTVGIPAGNLGSGEFRYEGTNPLAYSDTFVKETNKEANDYSDLINFARIVSAPKTGGTVEQPAISDADYPNQLATVLDVESAFQYFATDSLLGNREGGFYSGRGDDASIYRGILDPRFRFVHHDLDTVFDNESGAGATGNIFIYDGAALPGTGVAGLTRLFNHPELVPKYYTAVLNATNTWFNSATIDPIIDQIMTGWVPATDGVPQNRSINDLKGFVATRRANVLTQIQQNFSQTVTTSGADTFEGYKLTTTGAATFSGTFNVARTYSATVNGQLVTLNYRTVTSPAATAGTWSYAVPAGGGNVLKRGLNKVTTNFYDAPNGTGNVIQTFTAFISYNSGAGTPVSGELGSPDTLTLLAPESYIPGKPLLVRIDQKAPDGALKRTAWNTTVNLTASNGVQISPTTVTLYNGMGSALLTVGASSTTTVPLLTYGTGGTGTTGSGTPGSQWKSKSDFTTATLSSFITNSGTTWFTDSFDDSAWSTISAQAGYGNSDENTLIADIDYDPAVGGSQNVPCYLFRTTVNIADVAQVQSIAGQIKYDDAYRIYVNGVKVLNSTGLADSVALNQYATATAGDNATANITIPVSAFRTGSNTIAVQIHQNSSTSSDVTFDLRLNATVSSGAADPGNFTLTATSGALGASKALASLGSVTPTNVSGTLATGNTTWSGVINVTGDIIVPSGANLDIAAGTHVLMAGTAAPGDTTGADIIVNSGGALSINGTASQPVHITTNDPAGKWGQIYLNGALPTVCNFALISAGGHAPGQGHTSRGPVWRLNGASLTFNDSAMGDGPAKALYSSGTCDFVMQRSLMTRMITGPEVEDGTSILMEDSNIQLILPHYRESNAATPDDEDCLYVHNNSGRPVIVRRTVLARCGDDVFDCLGGPITVEDSIIREGWDKGMSLLNNDLTISRTLIVDCDKAIVPKSQAAVVRTTTVDRCTIVSENHDTTLAPWGYTVPPTSPDADTPSTGLYTQNKAGQSNAGATISIVATNSIIIAESPILVDSPYDPVNTVVNYSITRDSDTPATVAWTGTGNSNADPLFANFAADDYRLATGSPAIDSGDPLATDPDNSRADMGALPTGIIITNPGGNVTWTAANSPYVVTANVTVPAGISLAIQPGVNVQFTEGARMTVNGKISVLGTPEQRVVFSHIPGTNVTDHDVDPIKNGTQSGAPKWGGIRIIDSMAEENVVKYADFINAQGTSPSGTENQGSLGFIRSWGFCEGLTFSGTHLRMLYGRNPKLTVIRCVFPDMMIFDPVLGRIEDNTDFLTSADNSMEPLKVEYPVEAATTGAAWSTNGLPIGGWWRVYYNQFNGNRGHNDVFDADSGRITTAGDFLLDCRYNHFRGLSGDEHIDLGGDAYIASNIFEAATKDPWVSAFGTDNGYSNAISSGDKGSGTTIFVVRNICYDLDHVINCKAGTAAIFEHNTVANLHADYTYTPSTPDQEVKCAPINFFVPEDGTNPTRGDGAYMGFNLVSNVPRLFSGPDARKINGTTIVNDVTTKIEFFHNQLDQILDPIVGPNHPESAFSGAYGPNVAGAPGFVNPASEDYRLSQTSLARRRAPGGIDYGADVPEWAYILNGPVGSTDSTSASFTIGGPGIIAYKWRLNGGAWSAETTIGTGAAFPRTVGVITERQATLALTGLTPGPQTLEVIGKDMAGNWQDNDPARTVIGASQAAPTTRTWTIETSAPLVRISEVLANSATLPDQVELHNFGSVPVSMAGWFLSDDPLVPSKFALPATVIPAGGYATFSSALLGLDKDGDSVVLFQGAALRDVVSFGAQIADMTIGRVVYENALTWKLGIPSFGSANNWAITGETTGIRINEWFTGGTVLYPSDWIELANTSAYPVELSGMKLTDNRAGAPTQHTMPPLSFIAANGYLKIIADGTGGNRLSFSLSDFQDDISLYDAAGNLVDTVQFFQQTGEFSQGRDVSGAGGISQFELPTAGLSNSTSDANALALLRGLRVSEVMFNALGGQDFEYVELTNVGTASIQLQNVKFVQGITFTFVAPTTLNAGESLVVVKNLTRFRSRYGNSPTVAGTYSGNLDNSGETIALQLPAPYDANILTFAYGDNWRTTADGGGTALTTIAGVTKANLWGDKDTWTATALGGTPMGAGARTDTFSGWMTLNGVNGVTDDNDQDGVPALVESALGMNPQDANGAHGMAGTPVAGAGATFTFYVPENVAAAQGHGVTDLVYAVQSRGDIATGTWGTIAAKSFGSNWSGTVSIGAPANGFVPITVSDVNSGAQRFFRLQITWAP
jgi:hypothetical protein